ncbi:hypothetical protein ACLOJK_040011 [Asimina triloba]
MELSVILKITAMLVLLTSQDTSAQPIASPAASPAAPPSPSPPPAPAPPPGPDFINLGDLLSVAGPFQTFLNYLQTTQVLQTLQNQANNTQQGITIFVPTDRAFSSLKKPSLSNLTNNQLKSLLLFHALPRYYTLSDFRGLSSPVATMAGASYSLNFTDLTGTAHISSGWSNTNVSSSVHATDPAALYEVDKVLLPEAIFGNPPPPSPAPAPSPALAPSPDSATAGDSDDGSSKSSSTSSSSRPAHIGGMVGLISAILAGYVFWL